MLADRYDLALSTASEAARDAYVQGCDLALTEPHRVCRRLVFLSHAAIGSVSSSA